MTLLDQVLRHAPLIGSAPSDPLASRDPEPIRAVLKPLGAYVDAWFAPEVSGLEHIPDGPSLVVGTHNGGVLAPDMFSYMVAFWRHFGVERAAYGLAHDVVRFIPFAGSILRGLGAVPASQASARTLLARGATVLVYPGGDIDAFKPHRDRHVVKFGERSGFVRTALRAGVPIVPVISVGAHDTLFILTDGRELVERLGLKRLARIEVAPVIFCLPWGVLFGPLDAHVPLPSKLRIRTLPPMRFDVPPEAADDETTVLGIKEEVRATMQSALDELVAEGGFGPGVRFAEVTR